MAEEDDTVSRVDESVMVVVGEWTCHEDMGWKFVVGKGQMGRFVRMREDMSLSEIQDEIGYVFGLDRPTMYVELSFWIEGDRCVLTQHRMPPILIKTEVELKKFKQKRADLGELTLYASFVILKGPVDKSTGAMEKQVQSDTTNAGGEEKNDWEKSFGMIDDDVLLAHVEMLENQFRGCEGAAEDNQLTKNKRQRLDLDGACLETGLVDQDTDIDWDVYIPSGQTHRDEIDGISEKGGQTAQSYDCDAWTALINREYPLDWTPLRGRESNWGPLIKDPIETINKAQTRKSGLPIEPIGFSLGIDELDEQSGEQQALIEIPEHSSFVEDDTVKLGESEIALLEDAPPSRDNYGAIRADDRNMDLRLASDAIYVGRIFKNKKAIHKILSLYCLQRLFCFKVSKLDSARMITNCVDEKCSWRIFAKRHKDSENFEIRTAYLRHTCDIEARSRYGEKATSKILADLIHAKYANGKSGPRPCELPQIVLSELSVTISYMKAWHAKELEISKARGDEEASYKFLTTYLHLLRTSNPETITAVKTVDDNMGRRRFKYFFFAMAASIKGYRYLRKVIVVDGKQMTGKYKGCLVAACGQDGNMQIYPLAFGVVDSENENSWVWFFDNLKKFVPDDGDLVIVSDRHVSIYAAIGKVYPLAQHGACVVHLWRNIKSRFKSESLAGVVSKAARAYTIGDFRYWWDEIIKRSPKCAQYLMDIGLPHWTLSHFSGMRYNLISSNLSESLNAAMAKAVEYPIATMVEFLRTMLMNWFSCRREKAKKTETKCTPEIEDMLIENLREPTGCSVLSASPWIYQVNDASGCVFSVDLEKKTCTCREFDVMLLPCSHALAARGVRNLDIYSFVGECYKVNPWKKLYENIIMPIPKERNVYLPKELEDYVVNPPRTKRSSGRPRKVRIPSKGEGGWMKKKRIPKCGRCFVEGHNRKTCKNPI